MFLNMDQLEKQLDNEEFQEIGSMAAFKIPEFHDTLFQHMEFVKKTIDERAQHKREYDSWVNERQIQTTEEKVDTSKALDASLIDKESSGTESKEQETSNRSGNDAHADDADIRPIYDEEPMAEEREVASIKPHHVIASSNSRNSSKNMPRFSSNDMVHNHYLEEAKNKTQDEVNSRAKVPSNKTTNKNKPVEQTSVAKKPERQIPKGQKYSIKKTSVVHEKTMTPRSCLRWKPMSKIFISVGLRWVPTGKIFTSSTTKVDSAPTNGLNEDINNQYEYEQTLDVSAGTLKLSAGTSFNLKKEGLRVWLLKRLISQKPGVGSMIIHINL
ncbi:hypothetical protein Tco_0109673 [Tanacetum coccineum]